MPNYRFEFRKVDHVKADGKGDLHVHVWYNEKKKRNFLGRYRIPSLEPVFKNERELNKNEENLLRKWLAQKPQLKKLRDALESTLFELDKEMKKLKEFSSIVVDDKDGDTYLTIRIPVSRRL